MFKNIVCRNEYNILNLCSRFSSTNSNIKPIITNRNPRNLERLRIAPKPVGYYYDLKNVEYWHRLELEESTRFVKAAIVHNTEKTVIVASTKEWAIRKHLYSAVDRTAYLNLARIFAERCLETGISSCCCDIKPVEGSKVELFLKTLEEEGVSLKELEVYNPRHFWHKVPEQKPWLVMED